MWWIISVINLILLSLEAAGTTFMVMVMLNGFPSLPDAMVALYMVCGSGLLLALSLLSGWLAKKLAETSPVPLWLGGVLFTLSFLVSLPILLFILTFALLVSFGKV
jgi:hypothetical protein